MKPSEAHARRLKVAVVGPGAIGSAFAYRLARAGHDVTVVGRGKRLEELERDGAIVLVDGERAAVTAAAKRASRAASRRPRPSSAPRPWRAIT